MQKVYKYNQGGETATSYSEKEEKGEREARQTDQALLRSASMPPALAILSFRRRVGQ